MAVQWAAVRVRQTIASLFRSFSTFPIPSPPPPSFFLPLAVQTPPVFMPFESTTLSSKWQCVAENLCTNCITMAPHPNTHQHAHVAQASNADPMACRSAGITKPLRQPSNQFTPATAANWSHYTGCTVSGFVPPTSAPFPPPPPPPAGHPPVLTSR